MKRRKKLYLSLTFAGLLIALTVISFSNDYIMDKFIGSSSTANGLTVSVATRTIGGYYSANNVVAVWIESHSGVFIKTLTVYANGCQKELTEWEKVSKGNIKGAKTGAIRTNYGHIHGFWNGTDINEKVVPDGDYKVCMELCSKKGEDICTSFDFTKGPDVEILTPLNEKGFSSIFIKWSPL
jgi:hypothetical protein